MEDTAFEKMRQMGRQRRSDGRCDAMRTAGTIQSESQRKDCKDKKAGGGALATTEQGVGTIAVMAPQKTGQEGQLFRSNGSFPQTSSQH